MGRTSARILVAAAAIATLAASAAIAATHAGSGKPQVPKPAFSRKFDFEPGRKIEVKAPAGPLRVDWVRADAVALRAEGAKKESTQLQVVAHISNPSPRERRVILKASFQGRGGRTLAVARSEDVCEEEDEDDFEVRVAFEGHLAEIAAFTLDLDAVIE